MAFKQFGANQVLTPEDVNTFLMRQSIISVANLAEAEAITDPSELFVYRRDTQTLMQRRGSLWVPLLQDSGWQSATLLSGFAQHGTGDEGKVMYRLLNGVVWVRGRLTRTGGTSTNAFIFPENMRPGLTLFRWGPLTPGSGNTQQVAVTSGGTFTVGNNAFADLGLAGISFPVG